MEPQTVESPVVQQGLTDEEKKQLKREYNARYREKKRQEALLNNGEVRKVGRPSVLTEEEKAEHKREAYRRWYQKMKALKEISPK